MRKFRVRGICIEYIYAETEEEAIEQFDELTMDCGYGAFDEIMCEEMPLSHEKI
jgi:hypothetical protein